MGAGRAGGDGGVIRPLEAIGDRHDARAQIDQAARDEERADPPRPLFMDQDRRRLDRRQPANARPDQHAGAAALILVLGLPAGVGHRLFRRRHAIDDELVVAALFFRLDPLVGIEGARAAVAGPDLAGDAAWHVGGIEAGDRTGSRAAGYQTLPAFLDTRRQGSDETETRDDHSAHWAKFLRARLLIDRQAHTPKGSFRPDFSR